MPWAGLNMFISLSAIVLAAGFLTFFTDVIRSARSGSLAGPIRGGASTLEWVTSSPPPPYNFRRIPVVEDRDPLWTSPDELPVASGLRLDRREVVISTVVAAIPEARESSPRNSIWPLWAAVTTSIMLIWSIFTPWAVVGIRSNCARADRLVLAQRHAGGRVMKERVVLDLSRLPPYGRGAASPSWWEHRPSC